MFSWYPVMDLARAPRRAARKKGSGYENGITPVILSATVNAAKIGREDWNYSSIWRENGKYGQIKMSAKYLKENIIFKINCLISCL
jgi:hypothetical protein